MATNDINVKISVDTTQATKATDNYKKELKQLKDQMTQLQIATDGLTKASAEQIEEYNQLAQRAGQITDAMGDTAQQVKNLSDDYAGMTAALQGVSGAIGGITAVSGAMNLLGVDSDGASEAIKKVTSLMAILQGIQAVQKTLNKDSALMTALRSKSQKALNKELQQTAVAEKAGVASTTAFTAAENTATAASVGLKNGVKAVGTAIKSIPVVGWILAVIAGLTTVISLIADANDEEERGIALANERIKALNKIKELEYGRYLSQKDEESHWEDVLDKLQHAQKGTQEYADLIQQVSSYTGVSSDYLEKHPKLIDNITNAQLKANEAQKAYSNNITDINNGAINLQKLMNEQAELHTKQYSGLSDEEEERLEQLQLEIRLGQENQQNLISQTDELKKQSDEAQKVVYQYRNIAKANEDVAKKQKESTAKQKENDAKLKKQLEEQTKLHNEAQLAMLQMEIDTTEEGTELRLEAERNYLHEQERQEKEALKKRLSDAPIAEQDRLNLISELNAKFRNKETELDAKYQETLLAKKRKAEDDKVKITENSLQAELLVLEQQYGEQANLHRDFVDKQIEIDVEAENKEKTELERRYADQLIDYDTYLSEYDLICATHAKNRSDIEIEYARNTAEAERQIQDAKLQTIVDVFSTMGDIIEQAMESELQMVGDNEAEQAKIRKKYARQQFLMKIGEIGASTAKAIMETWASYSGMGVVGTVLAGIQTALLAATGIAQTNKARSAMNSAMKAERGGILRGKSHSQGGIKTDGGVELEGGEAIINKKSTKLFAPILSDINSYNGYGAPLIQKVDNGTASTATSVVSEDTIRQIVAETVNGVTAIPVVVTEHSISMAQRNVSVTEHLSII